MAKSDKPAATIGVKALVPVNYDGILYGPGLPDGDTFDCRETDVAQLKDVRAIEEVVAEVAKSVASAQ